MKKLFINESGRKRPAKKVSCEYCGTEFLVRADRKKTPKYCSRQCNFDSQKNRFDAVCKTCGDALSLPMSRRNSNDVYYCDKTCYLKDHSKLDIDWKLVAKDYADGMTYRDCMKKYGFSSKAWSKNVKRGVIKSRDLSEAQKLGIQMGRCPQAWTAKDFTKERRQNLRKMAIKNNLGGKRNSKKFKYGGVTLDSSYELRVAKLLDLKNIKWDRPKKRFLWIDKGKDKRYIPDFYLPDFDVYLDPKNSYLIERDRYKIDTVMKRHGIVVLVISVELIEEWEKDPDMVLSFLSNR